MSILTPNVDDSASAEFKDTETVTASGVVVSISKNIDYNYDSLERTYYELNLTLQGSSNAYSLYAYPPTIKVSDRSMAEAAYQMALQADVPADHPQKEYILYGMIMQFLRQNELDADNLAKIAREQADIAYRASLDKSYTDTFETPVGIIELRWSENADKHGGYTLFYPATDKYLMDQNFKDWEEYEGAPRQSLTMRPDLAQKMSSELRSAIDRINSDGESCSVVDLMEIVNGLKRLFTKKYLWSVGDDVQHIDVFYQDEATINGIEIKVYYNRMFRKFMIFFPGLADDASAERNEIYQAYIELSTTKNEMDAQALFEFACSQARSGKSLYEVFKETSRR